MKKSADLKDMYAYIEYGSLGFFWDASYYPKKQNNLVIDSEMISSINMVAAFGCCA